MNETVRDYCTQAGIEFTRCRPYRKNDQAWVEQKNGAVVRRTVKLEAVVSIGFSYWRRRCTHAPFGRTVHMRLRVGPVSLVKIRALRDRRPFRATWFRKICRLAQWGFAAARGDYLIVLGFAAAGIAAMLFFCEESNAGNAFRAIRKDPLLAQSQGIIVSASKLCASGR
jgi:branched-subunit amino acid ABC-type transport system permease component